MPIYSYRCVVCDNEFDVREGFDAPTVRDCTCGEVKTARRVIHPVGIIYKGTGFYTTDYARKGSGSSSSSNSSSSSDSSTSSTSSSETASGSSESAPATPAPATDKS